MREHAFLAGTHSLTYSFVRIKGMANMMHGGEGMYMDRFVTQNEPGLLLLHGGGVHEEGVGTRRACSARSTCSPRAPISPPAGSTPHS